MVDYREILRLHSLNYNFTQIAGALHSSRNTVREVIRLADEQRIEWPLDDTLTNVILKGAAGAGKSYIASALGVAACQKQFKVRYIGLTDLHAMPHVKPFISPSPLSASP